MIFRGPSGTNERTDSPGLQDPKLPGLQEASDAAFMAPRLRPLLSSRGDLEIHLLNHVPRKRCTLAFEFTDGTRMIGKIYRKERSRTHAVILEALQNALQESTRTPRFLALFEDLGMVVQEAVQGEQIPGYQGLPGRPDLVQRFGAALGDLHEASVSAGSHRDLAGHLRRKCHPGLQELGADFPALGSVLSKLETALLGRAKGDIKDGRPCHGDFHPRNLIMAGAQLYLVDLDGFCHSDPAFDVANFKVGLQSQLGTIGAECAGGFLAAYLDRRGLGALRDLAPYEALAHLRRAMVLWRKRSTDWQTLVPEHVKRSQQSLGI